MTVRSIVNHRGYTLSGAYIGGKTWAPGADTLFRTRAIVPVNGGPGPVPLGTRQPGPLGPQAPDRRLRSRQARSIRAVNPTPQDPEGMRRLIAAASRRRGLSGLGDDGTKDMIIMAAIGIGGAMAIYFAVNALRQR